MHRATWQQQIKKLVRNQNPNLWHGIGRWTTPTFRCWGQNRRKLQVSNVAVFLFEWASDDPSWMKIGLLGRRCHRHKHKTGTQNFSSDHWTVLWLLIVHHAQNWRPMMWTARVVILQASPTNHGSKILFFATSTVNSIQLTSINYQLSIIYCCIDMVHQMLWTANVLSKFTDQGRNSASAWTHYLEAVVLRRSFGQTGRCRKPFSSLALPGTTSRQTLLFERNKLTARCTAQILRQVTSTQWQW